MALDGGMILASLALTTNPFEASLKGASQKLKEFVNTTNGVNSRIGALRGAMQDVGGTLTKAVTAPLVGLGVVALRTTMEFDAQMSRVQSVAGASGKELEKLRKQAIDLGASTAYSASEAAEGMENLASAGFSVSEITAAMPGMLDLAAASGEDLANSADIAATTLRGFGLAASEAGHVADVLAKNANATNASVASTGEAMKYIAPVAHTMGQSLEEVSAAIGFMSDQGIQGSQAGTTLRSALISLAKPTDKAAELMKSMGFNAFDTNGKMLPLNEIIGRLNKALSGMTEQQRTSALATIFGTEALSGMSILLTDGQDKLKKYTEELKNSNGAAAEAAKINQNNLKGSIDGLSGAFESASIAVGDTYTPAIRNLVDWISGLVDAFNGASEGTKTFIVQTGLVIASVGPALLIISQLILALQRLGQAYQTLMKIKAVSTAVGGLKTAFGALVNPITLTVAALALLGVGVFMAIKNWDTLKAKVSELSATLMNWATTQLPQVIATAQQIFGNIVNTISQNLPKIIVVGEKIITNIIQGITTNLPKILEMGSNLIIGLLNSVQSNLPQLMLMGSQIINTIVGAVQTYLPQMITIGLIIIAQLINTISANLPKLINTGSQILFTILNAILSALPTLIEGAGNIISGLVLGITQVLPKLLDMGLQIIVTIVTALIENLPAIIEAALQLILALVNGITQNLPLIINTALTLIVTLAAAIIKNLPKILLAAGEIMLALIGGLVSMIPQLLLTAGDIIKQLWDAFMSINWKKIGLDIIDSIWQGIKETGHNLWEAAKDLGKKMLSELKKVFGINSPSRETFKIGDYLIQGLVNAVVAGKNNLKSTFNAVFGGALSFAQGLFSGGVGGSLDSWLTAALTITGQSLSALPALKQIALKESGGNPKAINLWDSNAMAGHPSKGLMQTIDETFRRYAIPGLGDIWNPIANAAAAIRYMVARYGSVWNVPGIRAMASGKGYVGYATGIKSATKGIHAVAEKGLEIIGGKALKYFQGGETVLNNKDSVSLLTTIANIGNILSSVSSKNDTALNGLSSTPVNINLNLNGNYAFTNREAIQDLSTQVSRSIAGNVRRRL
ncbi:phage tail tape measure protein [Clostridium kluyveri]|uniref:phage tail tape measure protein n=1 Tax=Clostridium kluyveri TaxID=1534 RepID=UPI0022478541|nr:phage tail tape measure protein [Clostridium kluyveri]UZQ49115.1 phage tail tape measure protein [Clostridium kluyveri]